MNVFVRGTAAFCLLAVVVAACGDKQTTAPVNSPLAGLQSGSLTDSSGTEPATPPANPGPGHFHGTILGHEPSAPGTDTLALFPRLANVALTAYPVIGSNGSNLELGEAVVEVKTDANGVFQFPTLVGGLYAVTIVPPAGSPYLGMWVTATASSQSADFAWWVVLSQK